MAQVTIRVNGVGYAVTCDDGQEQRLRELAAYLDARVKRLSDQVGQVGDARLLLLASLTVCDELNDAFERQKTLEARLQAIDQTAEDGAMKVLDAAARRVRAITARLDEDAA